MTKKKVDDLFFLLFCEKNSDGTKHLRLTGKEMFQRFGRRLNATDMLPLAQFLLRTPKVISCDLAYNNLNDDGIKILAQEFFEREENQLFYISLMHCDLHAPGLQALSSAKHLKLRKIRLVGNKFGAEGARFVGRLLENCPTLEQLDIAETDQTLESIESILIMVEKYNLKSLDISRIIPNSYYSRYNNSILADDLAVLLKLNTTLQVLAAQKCQFDGHDIELLVSGLKVHDKLTMLDLKANRIGDHGIQILAEWLRTRPNLICLLLGANNIHTPGAQALGLSLPFSRIRALDLQHNKIEDQGLAEILDSIRKCTMMRFFYIWGNHLGDMSLAKLERSLQSGSLEQDNIDVKIYYVDGKRCWAYYPSNHFKHRFYAVQDYGVVPELRIKRNKIPHINSKPRALVNFEFMNRYPPANDTLEFDLVGPCDEPHEWEENKRMAKK